MPKKRDKAANSFPPTDEVPKEKNHITGSSQPNTCGSYVI